MTLPPKYAIRRDKHLFRLFRENNEVYACRDAGRAEKALEEVAEWHERERAAMLKGWNSPHGSEEQAAWEKLRKEAERKMLEAQRRASGVGQWK